MRTFFEADVWAERAREGASAEGGEMFLLAVRRQRVVLQVLQRLQGEFLLDAGSRARGGNRKGAPRLKKGIHRRELLHQRALGLFGEWSVSRLPSAERQSVTRALNENMPCRTRESGETHRLVREHGLGDPAPVAEAFMKRRLPSHGEPIFRRAVQQELIPEEEFVRGVHARGFTSRIAEKGDGLPGTGAEGASRARSRAPIFTFVLEVLAQNIRELRVRVRRRRAEVWRPGEHNVTLLTARDASFSTVQGHAPVSSASFDHAGSQTLVGIPLFESMRESDSIGSPSS